MPGGALGSRDGCWHAAKPSFFPLVLEEHALTLAETPEAGVFDDMVATAFQALCPNMNTKRLVIVSDDDFQFFVRHATQVSARIKLDEEGKKTTSGKGGNLWYEETLPPETVLYALILANKPRTNAEDTALMDASNVMQWVCDLFPSGKSYLQVGGNETVGQGWCYVNFCGGAP